MNKKNVTWAAASLAAVASLSLIACALPGAASVALNASALLVAAAYGIRMQFTQNT